MTNIDDRQRMLELRRRIAVLQTALNCPRSFALDAKGVDMLTTVQTWEWMLDDYTTELWQLEQEDRL